MIIVFATLGANLALGVAALSTSIGFNWRIAFWIGTVVAVTGSVARTKLRETPEFADARWKIKKEVEEGRKIAVELNYIPAYQALPPLRTTLALFLIQCGWPACFYFTYIHCGNILRQTLGCTPEQVIGHNFIVSIVHLVSYVVLTYLSYRIYPLKILKVKAILFLVFILISPHLLLNLQSPLEVFLVQAFVMLFVIGDSPGTAIFLKHFPVFRRFTYASLMFALSRSLISIISSFGLVYLVETFGHWGVLIVMLPVTLGFMFGILHFEQLEKKVGNYPQKFHTALKASPA